MRHRTVFTVAFLLTLAACQLTPDQQNRLREIGEQAPPLVAKIVAEGPAAAADPSVWTGIVGLGTGIVGLIGSIWASQRAGTANSAAKVAQTQVDELYDVTHAPVTGKAS